MIRHIFLGLDICADSMSYSPLGDEFLSYYDGESNMFDSEILMPKTSLQDKCRKSETGSLWI